MRGTSKTTIIFSILIFLVNYLYPISTKADSNFDPEYIISNKELTDYNSMTQKDIQSFLEKFTGTLDKFKTTDIDGKKKLASEIIYRASQEYKINPKVLLTLLQKEKSLITDANPTKDSYNWAMGFACYSGGHTVSKFRGFAIQVDRAAWRMRYYIEHPWQFRFKVGQKNKIIVHWADRYYTRQYGSYITAKNQATANLYNYTPHLAGNYLFWDIWQKWFRKTNTNIPEGSLIKARGDPGVWLIQNNKRHPFHSKNVFLFRFNFKNVKEVTYNELERFEIGSTMTFPNYSIVQTPDKKIYMLVNNKKRLLSKEIFRKIGFHPEEIINVDEADLKDFQEGKEITSPYPTGALLQDNKTKGVYYVKEDTKYPLIDKTILSINFPYSHIIKEQPEELAKYKNGEPLKLKSGFLVKTNNDSTVYIIEKEKKIPIYSAETFEALGYQWENIITVPKKVLDMHKLGKTLKLE